MRLRTRVLLIIELLLGVAPVSTLYLYFFPVSVFWVREVTGLALEGNVNGFTSCISLAFVAGGLGLLSLWLAVLGRLTGRGAPGRIVRSGLLLGMAVAIAVLVMLQMLGGLWSDYYVYGAPFLVATHQLCSKRRPGALRVQRDWLSGG